MAVPKKKTSPSRRNNRRSHHALKGITVVENKETGEFQLPHRMSVDGFYKGRRIVEPKAAKVSDGDHNDGQAA